MAEDVIVDIREDYQLVSLLQTAKRVHGILERRPGPDGIREGIEVGLGRHKAQFVSYPPHDAAQNVSVALVRTGLFRGFARGVEPKELTFIDAHAVLPEDRQHRVEDPGLPVNKGAVAVECDVGELLEGNHKFASGHDHRPPA